MKKTGINRECLICKKVFYVAGYLIKLGKGKYCSKACQNISQVGSQPWWEKKGLEKLSNTGRTRFIPNDPRRKLIDPLRIAAMPRRDKHIRWKGDNVGYTALHDWVRKELGKPSICQECGNEKRSMYHWANKSGYYLRDVDDWLRLCVPCHKKYDMGRMNHAR